MLFLVWWLSQPCLAWLNSERIVENSTIPSYPLLFYRKKGENFALMLAS